MLVTSRCTIIAGGTECTTVVAAQAQYFPTTGQYLPLVPDWSSDHCFDARLAAALGRGADRSGGRQHTAPKTAIGFVFYLDLHAHPGAVVSKLAPRLHVMLGAMRERLTEDEK